jgi:multisite-specific tRNA:(cytosine-C5)-methyltransferase
MEKPTPVLAEETEAQNMEIESNTEKDSSARDTPPSSSRKGEKERKSKAAEGGSSFKEQPYTFLDPEDPILLNCM